MAVAAQPDVSRETSASVPVPRPRRLESIALDRIHTADNVRAELGDLTELVSSVRSVGILQPITVTPDGDGFVVLYGHRRFAAAALAGLADVPALVDETIGDRSPAARAIEQLVENLHRADLNPIEEAKAIRGILAADRKLTQASLAASLGRSAPWIANTLALLKADPDVQRDVAEGRLTAAHARAIGGFPPAEQRRLAKEAVERSLSSHELEEEAKGIRARQADQAQQRQRSGEAATRAVGALAATPRSAPIVLATDWTLDREVIERAIVDAGYTIADRPYGSTPSSFCDCASVYLRVHGHGDPAVTRTCTSESHARAAATREAATREAVSKARELERDALVTAARTLLEATPIDPLIARLIVRQMLGYNAPSWAELRKETDAAIVDTLLAELRRDSAAMYGKPLPLAAVIRALGGTPPESEPPDPELGQVTTDAITAYDVEPAMVAGAKPTVRIDASVDDEYARVVALRDPVVVDGVKYRVRAVDIGEDGEQRSGVVQLREHFAPHRELRDVAIADLTWDDVAGVWRAPARGEPEQPDSALDDVDPSTLEAARKALA